MASDSNLSECISDAEREAALGRELHKLEDKIIGFDKFLEVVLYNPHWGYYSSGKAKIGWDGADYFTNVSVGSIFAEAVLRFTLKVWQEMGKPREFWFIEQGAHEADFLTDFLAAARGLEGFWGALRVGIVEPIVKLQGRQKEKLADFFNKIDWIIEKGKKIERGIFFCNELLDALPFMLLEVHGGEWQELCVQIRSGGELGWCFQKLDKQLQSYMDYLPDAQQLGEGYRTEVRPAVGDWAKEVGEMMEAGVVLVCDYGYVRSDYYSPHRREGTMQCFSKHRRDDRPLENLGTKDITAHVDFTYLAKALESAGFQILGFADQHHFLIRVLKEWLLEQEGELAGRKVGKKLRALQMLIHPEMMGRSFHFLAAGKGWTIRYPVPGFEDCTDLVKIRQKLDMFL